MLPDPYPAINEPGRRRRIKVEFRRRTLRDRGPVRKGRLSPVPTEATVDSCLKSSTIGRWREAAVCLVVSTRPPPLLPSRLVQPEPAACPASRRPDSSSHCGLHRQRRPPSRRGPNTATTHRRSRKLPPSHTSQPSRRQIPATPGKSRSTTPGRKTRSSETLSPHGFGTFGHSTSPCDEQKAAWSRIRTSAAICHNADIPPIQGTS